MNASAGSLTTGKSSINFGSLMIHRNDAASFRLLRSAEDPENDENGGFQICCSSSKSD